MLSLSNWNNSAEVSTTKVVIYLYMKSQSWISLLLYQMAPPQQFDLFTLSEKRSSCVTVFCLLGNKRQRVHLYLLAPNKPILLTSWAIETSVQVLALCPFITCCQWCLGYNVYARLVFRGPTCYHRHLFYAVGVYEKQCYIMHTCTL